MPKVLHGLQVRIEKLKIASGSQFFLSSESSYKCGFTFIELLIVISILGIAGTLVTTSYLSFEKRQRVKSAALEIKGEIRLAQNNALSGFKGKTEALDDFCPDSTSSVTSELVGWYVHIDKGDNNLVIAGVCNENGVERIFGEDNTYFNKSVEISDLSYEGLSDRSLEDIVILFRPLENDAVFFRYESGPASPAPPVKDGNFLNSLGRLSTAGLMDGDLKDQEKINLTVNLDDDSSVYRVSVLPSGDISEREINSAE